MTFRILLTAFMLTVAPTVLAAEPAAIPLWPDMTPVTTQGSSQAGDRGTTGHPNRFVRDVRFPTLTAYPAPAEKNSHVAVVICPGGGYSGLAIDKEGYEMAHWLNTLGVTGVVLQYRMPRPNDVGAGTVPLPLLDVQRAVRYVRSKAGEWDVDPKKVGVLGFSAGGHLTSMAATHFDDGSKNAPDPLDRFSSRPDFVMLGYPVISMHEGLAHGGSRKNLLGATPDPKMEAEYSSEDRVTPQSPPAFVFLAKDDKGVKPANGEAYYAACRKAGVPAELHEYNEGGHGFGLGKGDSKRWTTDAEAWMRKQGILAEK